LVFTGYPSFTFTLPSTLTLTPNQPFYLALYSSDQPTLGYAGPIAASAVTSVNGKNTIAFTSAFNSGFTINKGVTYEFVVFTISTSLSTPSASPTSTATPAATATPTATPTGTPSATAAAPTVGYLAANPGLTSSFAGHLNTSTTITLVGIGTTFVDTMFSSNLSAASISASLSGIGTTSSRRAPLAALAITPNKTNPLWLNSSGIFGITHEDAHIEDRHTIEKRRQSLQRDYSARPALALRGIKATLPTTIGASAPIWAQKTALGASGGTYVPVNSTLQFISRHGYIWVDNTLTTLTQQQIAQIGTDFDNAYTSDVTHFGVSSYSTMAAGNQNLYYTCDSSGAKILPVVASTNNIVPADDKIVLEVLNPTNIGQNVGGYFSSINFIPQSIVNCFSTTDRSNEVPMIYVAYYGPNAGTNGNTNNFELNEDMVRDTAHELQHLINYVHHEILTNDPTGANDEASWINEGMSMLSQDFAATQLFRSTYPNLTNDYDAIRHANAYLASPEKFSITGFTGFDLGSNSIKYNCSACYGAEYVLQRYMYDRFGGDAYLRALLDNGKSGKPNIEAASGKPLSTLLGDFGIALAASGTGITTDPRWNFSGFDPRGTYYNQFNGSVSLSGPATMATLSPSSTGTVGPYLGSIFFVSVSAGNANISVTDLLGTYGLSVGVVQR
jgi:hypothetical protein